MATAHADISDDPRARIGGNAPPSVKELALIEVEEALKALRQRAKELLESAGKAKAEDAEGAGKCADLVKMIRACEKAIGETRMAAQKPYDDAIGVMRDAPRKVLFDLSQARAAVDKLATDFAAKERKRLADEATLKAKQEAEENAALQARAKEMGVELPVEEPKAEPKRGKPAKAVVSDMGSAVHTRMQKSFSVVDPYALPLDILTHPKVTEAIISVAREAIKTAPDGKIKGIIVTDEEKSFIR